MVESSTKPYFVSNFQVDVYESDKGGNTTSDVMTADSYHIWLAILENYNPYLWCFL